MNSLDKMVASGVFKRKLFTLEFDGQKLEGFVARHPMKEFIDMCDQLGNDSTALAAEFTNVDGSPMFAEGTDLQAEYPMAFVQKLMEIWNEASVGKTPQVASGK